MSGFAGGTCVGIARQTGRTTAQKLRRLAKAHRMVGNYILAVLDLEKTGIRSKRRND